MADGVGDGLPDHPAQQGRGLRRQRGPGLAYDGLDAGGGERTPGPVQLGGQARLAVASDGLPDLGERLPAHRLDVTYLLQGRVHVPGRDPAGGLGLHDDHREGVAEQVVQVAGEAQPLLVHGGPGQFLPGVAELLDRLRQGQDGGGDHARQQGSVGDAQGVHAARPSRDHCRHGGHGEHHRTEPAAPDDRAGGEAQQREEQQPVAAVGQREGAGDRPQRDQGPAGGGRLAGLLVEGPEHQGDVEGVEDQQAHDADPGVGGLALDDVGDRPHAEQQPGQQGEGVGRARRTRRVVPAAGGAAARPAGPPRDHRGDGGRGAPYFRVPAEEPGAVRVGVRDLAGCGAGGVCRARGLLHAPHATDGAPGPADPPVRTRAVRMSRVGRGHRPARARRRVRSGATRPYPVSRRRTAVPALSTAVN